MGIYDREYIRDTRGGNWSPLASTQNVCVWLVIINAILFLIQLVTYRERDGGIVTTTLAMNPDLVFHSFQVWRVLTGAFLHSPTDFWHIVVNMLFLYFFGRQLEDLYSAREFLAFYLTAGILANVFWGLTEMWVPGGGSHYALGASGAVMAVVVLSALHFPHRIALLMFVIPCPYWLLALGLVLYDLYHFLGQASTGVAVAAHLAGAAFGYLYFKMEWSLTGAWASFVAKMRRTDRPQLRIYREETAERAGRSGSATASLDPLDEQLEAKADAILEKVSQHGLGSLTQEEREILQRASEQYKRRRL